MYYSASPQQPLPAGWEAKYDQSYKKWYFINHMTKTTQWEDPRILLQNPTVTKPKNQGYTYQKPNVTTTTSFIDVDPEKVKQLGKMYMIDEELAKSLLRTHMNNYNSVEQNLKDMGYKKKIAPQSRPTSTTSSIVADPAKVTKLAAMYGVSENLAKTQLRVHANKFDSASAALKDLGYQKKNQSTVANNELLTMLKKEYPTASLDKIRQQLISTNNSPAKVRSHLEGLGHHKVDHTKTPTKLSTKPAVSDEQAMRELKKKFPIFDDQTIKLCLKVTQNNLDMATRILEEKKKKDLKNEPSRPSASTASNFKSEDVKEEPRDFAPKVFKNDVSSVSPIQLPSFVNVFSEESPDKEKSSTPTSSQSRAKEYRTPVKKSYQPKKKIVTTYKSSLRINPVGPNPNLLVGPDRSLLLQTYSERLGPNKNNRKGPQKSNCSGFDLRNRKGPANLAVGPQLITV